MKKRHLLLLLFTIHYSLLTNAQEYPRPSINLQQYIQEIVGNPGDNANVEDLYESLLQRYQSPLELNHATREELSSLYILSEKQLNAFFEYRKTIGDLNSIYELQAIPEWDLPSIYRVIPFVFVDHIVKQFPV